MPGKSGIQVTSTFPTIERTLYNVELEEAATREEIMALICQKTKLPPIHDDYVEMAPLDWFTRKVLLVRYQFPRRDLTALGIVSRDTFLLGFDPTSPVFIETDGTCAGNPGPGGWGAILNQGDVAVEIHGPDPDTTNNEMELRAIDEALKLLPVDFKGYVVIESDSDGCLKTMMGRGQRWQRDNYVNLKGNRVKNAGFVDNIIERLKTLTPEYRKVKGHNGDQWNDRADKLAVMGRDEAASWPRCSFDVIMPDRASIPFHTRSIPPKSTRAALFEAFSHETHRKLPPATEFQVYDSKAELRTGDWISGHYKLVHNSQPAPSVQAQPDPALAPDPAVNRSVQYGVFNGRGITFTPTQFIDCSKITMSRMLQEFNRAVTGFGDEACFFVGLEETDPTQLIPGQPYSVYPRKIKRPTENRVNPKEAVQAARIEGPMIGIQWKVTDVAGRQLCLPGNCRVPEEISLLQLFKMFITPKFRIQGIQIMWGKHYRGADILEVGQVSSLEEGDLVEIVVDQGTAPSPTHVEVEYEMESRKFKILVERSTTIEQLKQRLNHEHKGKRIMAIASEGLTIADEDPVEDWIQRTLGIPLTVVLPKAVQVVVDFRGAVKHFAVLDDVTEEEFKSLVKQFVGLNQRAHIEVEPLGLDSWEIRAGCTYWVAETKEMEIWTTDTSHGRRRLKLPGNATLNQACEIFRAKHRLPTWDDITITRKDNAPFWVEPDGEYTVEIVYNPAKDTRKRCTIKIITSTEHRVYCIDGYGTTNPDPVLIWRDICDTYGFIDPSPNFLQVG
jgi:ribonuclease HI